MRARTRMEFSKKLMIYASVMYGATWIVAVVSWFAFGETPRELISYTTWLYGAAIATYSGKSAYENKPKISRGK